MVHVVLSYWVQICVSLDSNFLLSIEVKLLRIQVLPSLCSSCAGSHPKLKFQEEKRKKPFGGQPTPTPTHTQILTQYLMLVDQETEYPDRLILLGSITERGLLLLLVDPIQMWLRQSCWW